MGLECCGKCIIVFINIVFMIIGIVFLAIGAVLLAGADFIRDTLNLDDALKSLIEDFTDAADPAAKAAETVDSFFALFEGLAIAILVIGIFMFAVTILGCCGACCSVRVMLIIYTVIVGVLMLTQIILMALYGSGEFDDKIKERIQKSLDTKYEGAKGINFESLAFNVIQTEFECCGLDNYKDFDTAVEWDKSGYSYNGTIFTGNKIIPVTCCVLTDSLFNGGTLEDFNCPFAPNNTNSNWQTGCFDEVRDAFSEGHLGLLAVTGGFLALEIICFVVSILILMLGKSAVDPV